MDANLNMNQDQSQKTGQTQYGGNVYNYPNYNGQNAGGNVVATISAPVQLVEHRKVYRIAAYFSYVLAFFYVRHILWNVLDTPLKQGWAYLVFGALFVLGTELFARFAGLSFFELKEKKNSVVEPVIFLGCVLLQSIGITLWGLHTDWEFYQFVMWHFTIIYYVMARTGALAAGRSGILFIVDATQSLFVIPWGNIMFRTTTIWKKREMAEPKKEKKKAAAVKKPILAGTILTIGISVIIAFFVCCYAFAQLSESSETFGNLGSNIFDSIDRFFEFIIELFDNKFIDMLYENMWVLAFSIPVGAWLFGLVGGNLKKKEPMCNDKTFEEATISLHQLPAYSAYIVIGSVCVLYAIFFGTALYDFINHKGLFAATAHEASVRAVGSFWSLIKVVILNFCIIAGSCLFSKKALWDEKKTRILATVLLVFALAFAVLAACNLCGVYIAIFGLTPRRILSSWVVFNVLIWCGLMLVRLYKKIPAAQIGIILAAVSFSVIVCFKF